MEKRRANSLKPKTEKEAATHQAIKRGFGVPVIGLASIVQVDPIAVQHHFNCIHPCTGLIPRADGVLPKFDKNKQKKKASKNKLVVFPKSIGKLF